jgi:hypothetical protein
VRGFGPSPVPPPVLPDTQGGAKHAFARLLWVHMQNRAYLGTVLLPISCRQ